jgi:hypothetical protein
MESILKPVKLCKDLSYKGASQGEFFAFCGRSIEKIEILSEETNSTLVFFSLFPQPLIDSNLKA